MRTIRKIERRIPNLKQRKKVAAYARVSMESERMHHSLSAQDNNLLFLFARHHDGHLLKIWSSGVIGQKGYR